MKLVLCHGVFDIMHLGHIRHLQEARKLGDLLIVTVTPDKAVAKGKDRPVFKADLRAEALQALHCVDTVEVLGALEAIAKYKPHIYVKGPECRRHKTPGLLKEIEAVRAYHGEVAYTQGEIFSSTEIIRKVMAYG